MNDPQSRITRILTLIPYVRDNPGVKLDDLARALGTDVKRVARDLDRLLLCGTPPYLPDDYIGVFIEDDRVDIDFAHQFRRPIRLTAREALALKLALQTLPEATGNEAYREARASLLAKIHGLLDPTGEEEETDEDPLSGRLAVDKGTDRVQETCRRLTGAAEERRACEIEYFSLSSDRVKERVVHPYEVFERRGSFYLVGWDELRDHVLHFRVDRIRAMRELDRSFERPEGWEPGREREPSYQPSPDDRTVRIRFRRPASRWVVEEFPDAVEEDPTDEGHVILTLQTGRSRWLVNWVLQYGTDAEILEPAEVREEVRDFLEERLAAMEA